MEQFTTQWDSFTQSAMASGKALEALNLKLVEDLGKHQSAFMSSSVEMASRWANGLTDIKALPEFVAAQGKLASEMGAQWLTLARETSAVLNASRDGYKEWLESGWKSLAEPLAAQVKPASRKSA